MAETNIAAYVNDITLCPICLQDCVDPRSLPCLHTFCFKCIDRHCAEKNAGDDHRCPVCREEFQIPEQGAAHLRHNFFIDGLVSKKAASLRTLRRTGEEEVSANGGLCEGCALQGARAIVYCLDCGQKLCEGCGARCSRSRKGAHKVVALGEEVKPENYRHRGSYCDVHGDEMLKMYCTQCRMNVCTPCYATKHSGHSCVDVAEAAGDFDREIQNDVDGLQSRMNQITTLVADADAKYSEVVAKVEQTAMSIREAADQLKKQIEREEAELLLQLESLKDQTRKKAMDIKDSANIPLMFMDSFVGYAQQLMSQGTPCDKTRARDELHMRANELQQLKVNGANITIPDIAFTSSTLAKRRTSIANNTTGRLLGTLTVTSSSTPLSPVSPWPKPIVRTTDPGPSIQSPGTKLVTDREVYGVTMLDGRIFVGIYSDQITVLGPNDDQQSVINVKNFLEDPRDLVACRDTRTLYIADCTKYATVSGFVYACIWKMSPYGKLDNLTSNRASGKKFTPLSLSVTARRLLVTTEESELLVYAATDGTEIRRVALPKTKTFHHAVETPRGTFVVAQSKPTPQVIEVDGDGRTVRAYDDRQLLVWPAYLAVDPDGGVFVADRERHHVLRLTVGLQLDRVMLEDGDPGRRVPDPCRLVFVQQTRQLVIGSRCPGRVHIIDAGQNDPSVPHLTKL